MIAREKPAIEARGISMLRRSALNGVNSRNISVFVIFVSQLLEVLSMAKKFNITGTCIPSRHYMADTLFPQTCFQSPTPVLECLCQ